MRTSAGKTCGIIKGDETVCRRPATIQTIEKGLICVRHYAAFKSRKVVKKVERICRVSQCTGSVLANNLCNKHYRQMRKHGRILKRTPSDPNEIVIEGSIAIMGLYDKRGNPIAESLFDSDIVEVVKRHKWHLCDNGYVGTNTNPVFPLLHQLVMGKPPRNKMIDHKNRNRLNNRRQNLRFVTHQGNSINRSIQSNNTSGTTGVSWSQRVSKWYSYIKINRKTINLGCFKDKKDAINARREAEEKYFGDIAPKQTQ